MIARQYRVLFSDWVLSDNDRKQAREPSVGTLLESSFKFYSNRTIELSTHGIVEFAQLDVKQCLTRHGLEMGLLLLLLLNSPPHL